MYKVFVGQASVHSHGSVLEEPTAQRVGVPFCEVACLVAKPPFIAFGVSIFLNMGKKILEMDHKALGPNRTATTTDNVHHHP